MAKRIQLHTFHLLFRLFSYLADKSGGWSMFVRPKLVIGTLILGTGLVTPKAFALTQFSSQKSTISKTTIPVKTDSIDEKIPISCYTSEFENETEPFIIVEDMPEFPGGKDQMIKFIEKHKTYPKKAINDNVEGSVICSFVVNTDGSISNLSVIHKVHPLLDKEAIRIIKLFPKWTPGKQFGKTERVKYTIPIIFTLPKK